MATTHVLKRTPARPVRVHEPRRRPTPDDEEGRDLVCAACRRTITTTGARIEMAGGHAHTFANPLGIVFHIACFAVAPGCGTASEASALHTWFPGYAWQVAVCRGCGDHLGWLFRSADSRFHGLIVDRLAEGDSGH